MPPVFEAQIEHELQLIGEMRYEHYFLTVYDIVAFARSRHILCQGRGSAANSVVCYCLGVTEVDPRLCADEVKSGQLVAPFDISIMTGRTYTLVCRPDETDLARIAAFRDWALTALVESNIPEVLEPKPA